MSLLSANVIVCETLLTDKADVASAIRIVNAITVAPGNNFAHFNVHTILNSHARDFSQHVVQVQVLTVGGELVAEAPEYRFVYANKLDFGGPGVFNLTTEFNLDLRPLGAIGYYTIWVFLDGVQVAGTLLMLRRA